MTKYAMTPQGQYHGSSPCAKFLSYAERDL